MFQQVWASSSCVYGASDSYGDKHYHRLVHVLLKFKCPNTRPCTTQIQLPKFVVVLQLGKSTTVGGPISLGFFLYVDTIPLTPCGDNHHHTPLKYMCPNCCCATTRQVYCRQSNKFRLLLLLVCMMPLTFFLFP